MSKKQLHKSLRKKFREDVFKRDGFKCKFCDETNNLDAHHIMDRHLMPNGGYTIFNGITLCSVHHMQAEMINYSVVGEADSRFYPNNLYKIINSSHEKAYSESVNLSKHP